MSTTEEHAASDAGAVTATPKVVAHATATTEQAPSTAVAAAHCKNCGAPLLGQFCVDCGQAAEVHVPTTGELIHEAMEGLVHADSRLWRTLITLWFKPGKLTNEFIAGRRAAYVPPFRLYLIVSIIFFLLASIHGPSKNFVTVDSSDSPEDKAAPCEELRAKVPVPSLAPRIVHACEAVLADNGASMVNVAVATAPKAMFIFLPVIAFLHMLLYWRPRHRYVEHLLFFLHLHAMVFSVAIVIVGLVGIGKTWPASSGPLNFVINPLVWATAIYSVIAMRRVFGRTWIGTLFKAFVMMMAYSIVFGLAVGGVFLYAALQL
jgi:Protein of unknown function (DUF3667)